MGVLLRRLATLCASLVLSTSLVPAPASAQHASPDLARERQRQVQTDRTWRAASVGHMRMQKVVFPSRAGDLDIPAFVFRPLDQGAARSRSALVWVHEDIRGHLYEHHIPFVREATRQGFVVIAPEYRGSIGYSRKLYEAMDYGGREVDDVVTAVDVLASKYPEVDPARIGILGWSHGGLIALLAVCRYPAMFQAAAAVAPVANLFQRLAWKGVDAQRALIDPAGRFGGAPHERPEIYKERSPLYQVDRLHTPVLVHVARNDEDVNFEEAVQLLDALRARKSALSETKVYDSPPGGHVFDRRVDHRTWEPENNPEQVDSWTRIWAFFKRHLRESPAKSDTAVKSRERTRVAE
jgi:dipeptidyl aminopeptidase/acylaminoacyl peptidase